MTSSKSAQSHVFRRAARWAGMLGFAALHCAASPDYEPERPEAITGPLSVGEWTLDAPRIDRFPEGTLVLTRGVRARHGDWTARAENARLEQGRVTLFGAVRIAGPNVFVAGERADVDDRQITARDDARYVEDAYSMPADEIRIDTKDATVHLTGVQIR